MMLPRCDIVAMPQDPSPHPSPKRGGETESSPPSRFGKGVGGLGLFAVFIAIQFAARADEPGAWKFDQVRLKNGNVFRGLILEETPAFVRFQDVRQRPGRPTVLFYTTFARSEIDSINALEDAERAQL